MKQVVEGEQQALLEMGGDLGGFEHVRLYGRGPQDVENKLTRVEMRRRVRDAGSQCIGTIEPAAISQGGREA